MRLAFAEGRLDNIFVKGIPLSYAMHVLHCLMDSHPSIHGELSPYIEPLLAAHMYS